MEFLRPNGHHMHLVRILTTPVTGVSCRRACTCRQWSSMVGVRRRCVPSSRFPPKGGTPWTEL